MSFREMFRKENYGGSIIKYYIIWLGLNIIVFSMLYPLITLFKGKYLDYNIILLLGIIVYMEGIVNIFFKNINNKILVFITPISLILLIITSFMFIGERINHLIYITMFTIIDTLNLIVFSIVIIKIKSIINTSLSIKEYENQEYVVNFWKSISRIVGTLLGLLIDNNIDNNTDLLLVINILMVIVFVYEVFFNYYIYNNVLKERK